MDCEEGLWLKVDHKEMQTPSKKECIWLKKCLSVVFFKNAWQRWRTLFEKKLVSLTGKSEI